VKKEVILILSKMFLRLKSNLLFYCEI